VNRQTRVFLGTSGKGKELRGKKKMHEAEEESKCGRAKKNPGKTGRGKAKES